MRERRASAAVKESGVYKAGVEMIKAMPDKRVSPKIAGRLWGTNPDTDHAAVGEEFLKADLLQFLVHNPGATMEQVETFLDKRRVFYNSNYLKDWIRWTFAPGRRERE